MAARGWGLDQDRNTERERGREREGMSESGRRKRDTQLGLEIYTQRRTHRERHGDSEQWGQTHRDRGSGAGKDKTER